MQTIIIDFMTIFGFTDIQYFISALLIVVIYKLLTR